MRLDEKVRSECIKLLKIFHNYIEHSLTKGLRVEFIIYEDWCNAISIMEKYDLLPADALHVAVALRIKATSIAISDEDLRVVKEIKIFPRYKFSSCFSKYILTVVN